MQSCAIRIVRPDLNHVADIDDKSALHGFDVVPITVLKDLKAADAVLNQNGDRARIAVVMDAEVGTVARFFGEIR